jgi:hypothetical protein
LLSASLWKVEHKKSDGSLLIGYEYTYDLLGRIEQSVERPSGDTTVYTYTPAGRLESEVRAGQVWYSRYYGYNLDGSRQWVLRDDALNGTHWDVYAYDPISGRLSSVTDTVPEPDVMHQFAWNPEGTLARWEDPSVSYARVFGYDEEGRLVKIERDYGSGGVQVAYAYGYNSDGVRVWKQDVLNQQEYRYVCRIGCGGVPMRVYNRAMSGGSWASVEDYLETPTITSYSNYGGNFGDYQYLAGGRWLFAFSSTAGEFVYFDAFGATPVANELRYVVPPLYLGQDEQSAFFPAALKVIIVGGLVLIGISLCLACTNSEPQPAGGGSDAFLHCYFGCVGCSICGCPPGLLGPGKELADLLFVGGSVEGRDVINTEIGCALGKLLPRLFPVSWKRAFCERACRVLEGRGLLF